MGKVSILVPIYNVEKYIERCAVSLFEQTYKDIEYIFVDDKGTDSSIDLLKKIISKYPERADNVKIVDHIVNRGLAVARNTGLENASGEYILHVDSDDFLELTAVEQLYNKAISENADMVVFDINNIHPHKNIVNKSFVGDSKYDHIKYLLYRQTPVCLVLHFTKREICLLPDVRPIVGLNFGEDYVVSPRISYYASKIVHLSLPLYNYTHNNSISYTNNITKKSLNSIYRASCILRSFFESKPDASIFTEMLDQSDVINKILLITHCHNNDIYYANNLYPNISKTKKYHLSIKHRIIWYLSVYNQYLILKLIKHIWIRLKRI